jgi:hypothetical protein
MALVAAGALGVAGLSVAGAQTGPAPDGTAPDGTALNSWSLTPAGATPGQPSTRPSLSYTLDPGATVEDSITVWNYGDTQLTFRVYATDALNTSTGAFDLLPGDQSPQDVGSWVKIPQELVTVPARTSLTMPITVSVPTDATPGDHTAGVVAASKTPGRTTEGQHVVLDRRTGTRLYVRVNGPVRPSLVVENLSSKYHAALNPLDGELEVTYTIRNDGNVRLGARPRLEVGDLFGTVAQRPGQPIPELLPGNAVTFTERFEGVSATLRVSTDVDVVPFAPRSAGGSASGEGEDSGEVGAPVEASASAWAIPWVLLGVLVVLLVTVVVVRRRRAGGRAAPPPPRAAPRGPGGPRSPGTLEPLGVGDRSLA